MAESDTYAALDCRGVVYNTPCTPSFVHTAEINGNLVVRADKQIKNGGNILIEGPCSDKGCREDTLHSVKIDGDGIIMKSGGPVSIEAANTDRINAKGSELLLFGGNGTNIAGGSGGDVHILAGNGAGSKYPLQ